ncbi:hypothetical protein [Mycolicibacterium holsaticum]|uniref:Uncharacterized protein n=1 Tax=Mycolicibacterium holsaticum TaxID=152142 RepID=A0A1E3RWZ5_9MYCO|nr:hypothetical protein [Mycolicibacterium holsaticum]ODQ94443.1 hypothetical protein BHQ17_08955 [Mycolicibacterium holsaticum]
MHEALDAWESFAVALLAESARTYRDVVTYKQLGETVQAKSGITHNGLLTNWIGSLLGRIINYCVRNDIPQLSALCVKEDGTVGEGYRHAAGTSVTEDLDLDQLDDYAAQVRWSATATSEPNFHPAEASPP